VLRGTISAQRRGPRRRRMPGFGARRGEIGRFWLARILLNVRRGATTAWSIAGPDKGVRHL